MGDSVGKRGCWAVSAVLVVFGWLALANTAAASCSMTGDAVTCTYTGAGTYTFSVPAGGASLDVTAVGAAGGAGGGGGGFSAGAPGLGASVEDASLTVGGNQDLSVIVGAVGANGGGTLSGGAGGVPGGGAGGNAASTLWPGGGGGGYSGLFGPSSTPLVIAGGGGGGAGAGPAGGGGDIGSGGHAGANGPSLGGSNAFGGAGATGTAGGAGGGGQFVGACGTPTSNGSDGSSVTGGQGGFGNVGGGGGGGGYSGGGGGGGGCSQPGGGGGGGASFGVGSLTNGANITDPASVTIRYTMSAPTASITTPANGATYAQGQVVQSSFSCSEGSGGTGIASCTDQNGNASGTAIDTSTPGAHTLTAKAISKDGLGGSSSVSYTVIAPAGATPAPPVVAQAAAIRVDAPSASVFGAAGSPVRCTARTGLLRSCRVTLLSGGRVLARGRASGSDARVLTVRLRLTASGRTVLVRHLGGVRVRVTATAATSGGTRSARARTRALLAVEHVVTPPGSWTPNEAALSARGRRFLQSLRTRLIAVAAVRCDGYSAKVREESINATRISVDRAAAVCAALRRFGVTGRRTVVGHGDSRSIASNTTAAGRARNRRVEVTIRHRPTRM